MTLRMLRRIYQEQKIKRKRIKVTKVWTDRENQKKEELFAVSSRDLEQTQQSYHDVIYVDEVMFTKHT